MLYLLVYLGGALTIVSPCILPVLPFVFARTGQPFVRAGLPLLIGMGITFALVASLAVIGARWAVQANEYGRIVALVVLALLGLTLLSRRLASFISGPLVALGNRLTQLSGGGSDAFGSLLLGVATGLLWAPCAGPILGLVLTSAVVAGPTVRTSVLLLLYAAGAATSLAVALLAGGQAYAALKRSLGAEEWLRRGLGVAVLAAVAAVALGADRGFLTQVSAASTAGLEQGLLRHLDLGADTPPGTPKEMPDLNGAVAWLNSPPLTRQALAGHVVLVDFWTYSCINCLRTLPYVRAWAGRYHDSGLIVLGIHSPEFAFEQQEANVRRAVAEFGIQYPVALDNRFKLWQAFGNQYWPAHYLIDAQGRIRYRHYGEGDYAGTEAELRRLLAATNAGALPPPVNVALGSGAEAAPANDADRRSPETYLGYARAERFAGSPALSGAPANYASGEIRRVNNWGLDGRWQVSAQAAELLAPDGRVVFRFHGRDVHLVLGPGHGGPVRIKVTLDGEPPMNSHGADVDAAGAGVVTEQRLYQLIRQPDLSRDHTIAIEFLDPGVEAYAFTFG